MEKLRDYPKTEKFECIDTIGVPHLYCITSKHVSWASDKFDGMLNTNAIKDAEKHGAGCGICKCKLKYEEHEQAILVEVNDERKLKDIPELKDYLLSIKEQAEKDGFAGFAFKQKKGKEE